MSKFLVLRANTLALTATLLLVAILGGLTWKLFGDTEDAREWVQHTSQVAETVKDLAVIIRDAETGQRGYLLTGDESYLAPYERALDRAGLVEGELQRLTADNPVEQQLLQQMIPQIQHKLTELGQTIQLRRDVGLDAALRIVVAGEGQRLMIEITRLLNAMSDEEHALLVQRIVEADRAETRTRWLAMAGVALAIAMIFIAIRMLHRARNQSIAAEVQQRALAAQLRTSLDSLSQGLAVFTPDHLLATWNDQFAAVLQLPKHLVMPRMPYGALARHLSEAAGTAILEELRAGERQTQRSVVYERTAANAAKLGENRSLEIRRTAMPDEGFVLTVTDMTDRVRSEAIVRDSQRMQAIGQLTGGVAHDFNNLLTVVGGNVDLARETLGPDHPVTEWLNRSAPASERGAALTRQLLAFARRQPLEPQPLDVSALLPDLTALLQRTLGEHIDIRVVDSVGLWPAMADAVQVESAVLNLALNARDAMPGGGRLTIEVANKVIDLGYATAHHEVTPGDYVMLAVSDTGQGMTADVLARAFEPFFTTKPDGKGTGLGLAQVFGFVKQSGGHVKIYSEPGEGTTVKIYLPRAMGVAFGAPRIAAPQDVPRGSSTVLVIEDEQGVRDLVVTMLQTLGYKALAAADGETGLALFRQHADDVDLLLVDVVLPGQYKGRAVAEMMSEMRPGMKVLFMSGYTENAIVHHGRLDDGVALISKPFKREQLARKLAELFGRSSGEAAKVVNISAGRSRPAG